MEIRTASDEDWPSIWPFFHAIVAAGETYTIDPSITSAAAQAYWLHSPSAETVVAVLSDTVVGTAVVKPNQSGPGGHVANASFMVSPTAAGQGIGRALGVHILSLARTLGYRAMQFNAVVSVNAPAVHLWQSLGFQIVGTVPGSFAHPRLGDVDLLVMHRWL